MELTEQQRKLQSRLQGAARRANDAQGIYARLKAMCKHAYEQAEYGGAYCAVCGDRGGWWCPTSPTHVCQYSRDFDSCDFCGEPEERK